MPDGWEVENNLNPVSDEDVTGDPDDDGLENLDEFLAQTDPNDPDSDSDGLTDGEEIFEFDTDPLLFDTDNDGLNDSAEVLLYYSDPNKQDTDNDGLDDNSEVLIYKTHPNKTDTDGDGLLDGEEVLIHFTNATSNDTDNDGMPDGWEVENRLNPVSDKDVTGDPDDDDLENIGEYEHGLDPFNPDTDGDKISDGWEVKFGLNASDPQDALNDDDNDTLTNLQEYQNGLNPFSDDTDADGMPDDWEVLYGLNGNNTLDAFDDGVDKDGLSNLEEYEFGTDPTESDTDRDGMDDGWEVDHGLNATLDDALKDLDGDLLHNYYEYKLNSYGLPFKPDSPIDVIISSVILLMTISYLANSFIRKRRLNKKAKFQGFLSLTDKKQTIDLGFPTPELREEAKSLGFLSSAIKDIVQLAGYKSVDEMIESWKNNRIAASMLKSEYIEEKTRTIQATRSPIELNDIENEIKEHFISVEKEELVLHNDMLLQRTLIDQITKSSHQLIQNLDEEKIKSIKNLTQSILETQNAFRSKIEESIDTRKNWFKPWQSLLTLIQVTEDGVPLELDKIVEVIDCHIDQAENLLKLLLLENPHIGKYDPISKVYNKGVDIQSYLSDILSKLKDGTILDED